MFPWCDFQWSYQLEFSKYNHLYDDTKLFCGMTEKCVHSWIFAVVLTWIKAKNFIFFQFMSGTDWKQFSSITCNIIFYEFYFDCFVCKWCCFEPLALTTLAFPARLLNENPNFVFFLHNLHSLSLWRSKVKCNLLKDQSSSQSLLNI